MGLLCQVWWRPDWDGFARFSKIEQAFICLSVSHFSFKIMLWSSSSRPSPIAPQGWSPDTFLCFFGGSSSHCLSDKVESKHNYGNNIIMMYVLIFWSTISQNVLVPVELSMDIIVDTFLCFLGGSSSHCLSPSSLSPLPCWPLSLCRRRLPWLSW